MVAFGATQPPGICQANSSTAKGPMLEGLGLTIDSRNSMILCGNDAMVHGGLANNSFVVHDNYMLCSVVKLYYMIEKLYVVVSL